MFKKGQSGNPAGRPKGIASPQAVLRKAIAEHVPGIISVMAEQALGGDTAAASLLLSRVLSPARAESLADEVSATSNTLADRAEAVAAAAMAGEISTSTAAELMSVLNGQARVKEIAELEERIAALEGKA